MDESAALAVTAVRAVEIADRGRSLWSDADRAWASRAAAEVVGETADGAAFVARRAGLALERLGERSAMIPRAVRALRWRRWVGWMAVVGAFVAGLAIDRIGGGQRINLLAPPVFALLLWNLAVYALLAIGYVLRYGDARAPGPLRLGLLRAAAMRRPRGSGADGVVPGIAALTRDWARVAGPLYAARTARILHLAAAALALGVIAGLYLRGLALEYRAGWESTFLDAQSVRTLLAIALAPGSWVSGLALPSVDALAAIRSPASENAALWLHLFAATVMSVVVLPRALLAAAAWLLERHRAAHLPIPLAEPYFQRLLRGFRGGPQRVRVIPYSYALSPSALAGLELLVQRSFGGSATVTVESPRAYGDEDAAGAAALPAGDGYVIALFSLTATPERETHGAFVASLVARSRAEVPLLVLVDESAFRGRWPDDAARIAQRQALWRESLATWHCLPVFVDLGKPDLPAAELAIDAALAAHEAAEPGEAPPP